MEPPKQGSRDYGSEDHREMIFERSLTNFHKGEYKLKIGDSVRIKGTHLTGEIHGVCSKFTETSWAGMKCRFVEVYIPTKKWEDAFYLVHPNELEVFKKRSKK